MCKGRGNNNYWIIIMIAMMLVILSNQTAPIPSDSSIWGSYQVRVAAASGNLIGNTGLLTYSVQFTSPITNINELSAVLGSYEIVSTPNILFRVNRPTYISSNNSAVFGVQIFSPTQFAFMNFFIVYNTQEALNYFEIYFHNQTYPSDMGTLGSTTTTSITSTVRLNKGADIVTVIVLLSSVKLYNNVGGSTNAGTQLELRHISYSGTSSLVQFKTKGIFREIVFTTFIVKTNLLPIRHIYFLDNNVAFTNSASYINSCQTGFGIDATLYGSVLNKRCLLGIQIIDDDYSSSIFRKTNFNFQIATNSNITSCINDAPNPNKIKFNAFCWYEPKCQIYQFYDSGNTCTNCTLNTQFTGTSRCIQCTKNTCYRCQIGYYPTSSSPFCVTCTINNCSFCTTASTCIQCVAGSYLNNNNCLSCSVITNCDQCSNITYCTKCSATYGKNAMDTSCALCSTMLAGCTHCTNSTYCTACNNNYFISASSGVCSLCYATISNCLTCASFFNCTSCNVGYFLQTITRCIDCRVRQNYCSACNYTQINSTTTIFQCTACQPYYYLSGNGSCQVCSITGCYICSTNMTCTTCLNGYYKDNNLCHVCNIDFCVRCDVSALCTQCKMDFVLADSNSSCVCKDNYWQVTGVCVNEIGCVTAISVGTVTNCIFCSSNLNFQISGTKCVCKTGYFYENGICQTKCGDSLILGSEQCDDGNTDNDDGCSSTCLREANYICGYIIGRYYCTFSTSPSIKLQYILRDQIKNSAVYQFTISPSSKNYQLINLQNYFELHIPAANNAFKVQSIAYSSGKMSISVDFTSDIQNLDAYLIYTLDPNYFTITSTSNQVDSAFSTYSRTNLNSTYLSTNQTVTNFDGTQTSQKIQYYYYAFSSSGTNAPLTLGQYASHTYYMKLICYLILGLGAVILLLSIAYEKMIGVQTINVIQIIVYTKLLSVQNQLLVAFNMTTLKYINGYNEIGANWSQTHQLPLAFRRLKFNTDYILNFQTGIILIALSFIILLIFTFYRLKVQSNLKKSRKVTIDQFKLVKQQMKSKLRFIYERIFLLFAFIILFDCIAAIRLQSRSIVGQAHYSYSILNVSGLILSVFYIFGIFSYELFNVNKAHQWKAFFCQYNSSYIFYYICYLIIVTPILIAGQVLSKTAVYIFTALLLINFVTLIIWRPYKQTIHNFSIIFNGLVVIFLIGYTIFQSFMTFSQSIDLIFSYSMLGLIVFIQILAFIRVYIASRPPVKQVQRLIRNETKIEDQAKHLIKEMGSNNPNKKQNKMLQLRQEEDYLARLKMKLKRQFLQNQRLGEDII